MKDNVVEGFRLSPQQRKLWRDAAEAGERRTRAVVRLDARPDLGRLRRALVEIVERHEILRTVFRSLEGMDLPIQVVEAEPLLSLEQTAVPHPGLEPPLHCTLSPRGEGGAELIFDLPALSADEATITNLLAELAALYAGEPVEESEPAQYVDVSEWLNQTPEDPEAAEGIAYWRRMGLPDPDADRLPLSGSGEAAPAPRFATVTTALAPELTRALAGRAAEHGIELPALYLGSWAALCRRLVGRDEVVVGWRHPGRKFAELEPAFGPFARELPARFKIALDLPLVELWRQAERLEKEADEWQELFSWESGSESGGDARPGYFPIAFGHQVRPATRRSGGLSFELEELISIGERFELRLEVIEAGGATSLRLVYDAERCRGDEAERMLERFATLLASAAEEPGAEVGELALLSAAERQFVLERWNQTARELPEEGCWHRLFEAQAARTPDAVALVVQGPVGGAALSYLELDRRANALAHRLRALGIGADDRVALCLERSAEQVVGALAALAAGAAFAAVDPAQPEARLTAMIEEAGARAVLAAGPLPGVVPGGVIVVEVDLEADSWDVGEGAAAPAALRVWPEQLAYGIFTSGSTGRPKCVLIRHRSVVNLLLGLEAAIYHELGAPRRLSLNAPLSFDSAIKQFIQLAAGHTLCLVPEAVRPDGEALAAFLAAERVEVLDCTPSQLGLLLAAGFGDPSPTTLLVGGEAIAPELWRALARETDRRVYNLYGPTECTVDVTSCRVAPELARPLLGRPLANHRVYLLDGRLEPVPAGCPGELWVAGEGLARGYARARQSAERFVPDPFAAEPGGRLYRTGDRARLGADGRLEYLGRADHQVKLRGFRIELGEIESVLESLPGIDRAAAAVLEESPGGGRLVAWVVPARDGWEGEEAVRDRLRRLLPEAMMPAAIVTLDALPLGRRGKVDRDELPAPETLAVAPAADLEAPTNPFEEVLATVWAEILGLERVGIDQSFFELGGHSLLATQLMARVRRVFQVEVALRALFDAPTVAGLAAAVSSALAEGRGTAAKIEPVERDGGLPLSFAQQRLWYLDQLHPGSPLYNTPKSVRLDGRLEVAALGAAFSEIVRRHEVLRSTFPRRGGVPHQVPGPAAPVPLPLVDLGALDAPRREALARCLALEESLRPFDLARGPLLRTALVRLGAREHVLLVSMHHVTTDARSLEIFVAETAALYRAAISGEPSPLAELPIQYADFASFQRAWLVGERLERELGWWRGRLEGATTLELPLDRPRQSGGRRTGRRRTFRVPAAHAAALERLGRREGATPFMILAAVFSTLLYRLSAQRDVVLGTPVANRGREELEGLIGCFLNNLVLRVGLAPEASFTALLEGLREVALGAFSHQELPFEKIVEAFDPERDLTRNPLFQVFFSYQRGLGEEPDLGELELGSFELELLQVRFDLELHFAADGEELTGTWVWPIELFDTTTILRFERQLLRLLGAVAEDASRPLDELPWLGPAERHQVVVAANDTRRPLAAERGLDRAVFGQAARTPDAVASVGGESHLSYGELERRAARLAAHLRRRGLGPEARVAVTLERSPELVVAWLGVLAAGAAYVPADPNFPPARLEMILEDAGSELTLDSETLAAAWAEPAETPAPATPARPENLAYAIFTSGSTGRPKGVQISHRAVVNFLASMAEEPGLAAGERWLSVTTPAFDIAALEIFLPLAVGATVELAERASTAEGTRLAELLARSRSTVMQATPATWQMLFASGWRGQRGLRILCGGEALPPALAERLLDAGEGLWNLYGPTETTIWSAVSRIDAPAPITLGRPIANTELHVLDRALRPLPPGVVGELSIGGEGLSRGYLGAPAQSAERFVPDPFAPRPGARLYTTGDLARRLADGRLDFLGRADHQVKIRGFRIELGEIENVLAAHPGVRAAAAAVRAVAEDRRLVAYLVAAEPGAPPSDDELRSWLGERLPAYMVPAAFVVLEALPRTPNGKLDRRALPELETPSRGASAAFAAPRTPLEKRLAALWCELFGLDRVGVREGFFRLGGHSLLATRLLARLRAEFGFELPLAELYPDLTIAELGARLEAVETAPGAPPPIPRRSRRWPVPASFAQRRLWFVEEIAPGLPIHHLFQVVRLEGEVEPAALARGLAALAVRQEVLATVLTAIDGEPYQRPMAPAPVPLAQVDLRRLAASGRAAELRRALKEEAERPFALDRGPLWRVLLVRGPGEALLLLTLHHLLGDAWSMEIWARELEELYAAELEGRPAELGELPIQFADYAVWQREALAAGRFDRDLTYWRERLDGAPSALELPYDRRGPMRPGGPSDQRRLVLGAELAAAIRRLGREREATSFTIFIALFAISLGRFTGADDVVISTPVAGRSRLETQGLIGFFVDNLVLRADLSRRPSFAAALERVRRGVIEAQEHQDLPFEVLVEELRPVRGGRDAPWLGVVFAHRAGVADDASEPYRPASRHARFPLLFQVVERSGAIELLADYARDLFDATTLGRWLVAYRSLLETALADPERPISELSVLGAAGCHQLLAEWNDTASRYPGERSPSELFAERAAGAPDAVALVSGEGSLSYGELARRVEALARQLRGRGVGAETPVALAAHGLEELVVGALGILAAGGAYVPLDPDLPAERAEMIVGEAGARLLVGRLASAPAVLETIALAGSAVPGDAAPELGPSPEGAGDALAYVMYTSGSTGRPKGVAVTRRAIVRLVCETDYVELGPGDRVAQASNSAFDATTFEIWGALLAGGALVELPRSTALAPRALAAELRRQRIDTIFLTTALFNEVVNAEPAAFGTLRELLFGGEAVDPERVRRCLASVPPRRLLHVYGPTESTTFATWRRVRRLEPGARTIAIGTPIANTRLLLLDRALEPVPPGVLGEIHLGGDGLARGYFDRPAASAGRFVPDPFAPSPGARLYRTGDLARQRPAGEVEFVGRRDLQVKIRGFRIEPGEVEAVLEDHPAVARAVVLVLGERSDDRRLFAFAVPAAGSAPGGVRPLRGHLRARLPEFMMPAGMAFLEELPLNPNGKVDRAELREIALRHERAEAGPGAEAPSAPRGAFEETIAEVWAEVLRLRQVDVRSDFFELGGHSLLATRIVARLQRLFDVDLPLSDLFEAPTVAGLAARLEERLARGVRPAVPPLVAVERTADLPLSFAQRRLYFLDRFEGGSAAYNVPLAVRLDGRLDVGAFAATLAELVRRHEILRTRYRELGGRPVQSVAEATPVALPIADLRALASADRERRVGQLLGARAREVFDLAHDAPLRFSLLRTGEREYVLGVVMHHIACDGWSLRVMVREVAALYDAFAAGRRSPLAEPALQYADYALWQRRWLRGEALETLLDFWREALGDAAEPLELPTDRPRPAVSTLRGASRSLVLERPLIDELSRLARASDATLFMVFFAAFATLLHRLSGQREIRIGTPIAGRHRVETEDMIGLLINLLVLRSSAGGETRFRELIAGVRETALAAYLHQDLPFERLVEELAPVRDLSRQPLFQVVLMFQNLPRADVGLAELELEPVEIETGTAKFELTLTLSENADGLVASLEHNRDLFDSTTAVRWLRALRHLLEGVASASDRRLDELPWLGAAELHQLLAELGDARAPAADLALTADLSALASEAIATVPDKVALSCGETRLSYGELGRRVAALARRLRALGVGPEVKVGVALERSLELPIALASVLAAGGAWVPLDPSYPRERLEHVLTDSGVALVLTTGAIAGRLPIAETLGIVDVDELEPGKLGPGDELGSDLRAEPSNLAYTIYTSGSTGLPKGVEIPRGALHNFLASMAAEPGLARGERLLALTTPAFDIAVLELLGPLAVGGEVEIAGAETAADGRRLAERLEASRVSAMQATPATWRILLEAGWRGPAPARILCGGEALPSALAAELCRRGELWNLYGPTETTVWSARRRIEGGAVTIGRPIAATRLHVVDSRLEPAPLGVPGALLIGGAGLARGYRGKAAWTAERFLPDPFSEAPGARLYAAGDRARRRGDGEIEVLGRLDHQLKVRGFRIEPGEVEAALARQPGVRQCAVVARGPAGGEGQLVAYVVAEGEVPPAAALREGLRASLPEYMVPALFVPLESLPLTPNLKVDRRALPEPPARRSALGGEGFAAPRTPREEALAEVWCEVLGLDRVGAHDHFFELGGDSLRGLRLIAGARRAGLELTPRQLFQHPTLAALAEAAGEVTTAEPEPRPAPAGLDLEEEEFEAILEEFELEGFEG